MTDAVRGLSLKRLFLSMVIGSLMLAALLAIAAIIGADWFGVRGERILGSTVCFAFYSLTSLGCAYCIERGHARVSTAVGIGCAGFTFIVWMFVIWGDPGWDAVDSLFRTIATGTSWCVLLPHIALLPLARVAGYQRVVMRATRALALLLTLVFTAAMLLEPQWIEHIWQLLAVLGVLVAFGTIAVPIFHWLGAARRQAEVLTSPLSLNLTCPRCSRMQTLPAGRAKCAQCGLRLRIEIEEERCPGCGYVVYELTSDRCPECGRAILSESGAAPGRADPGPAD
jgi:hypothetical protein